MNRKVFISVLGTGFYSECVYGTADGRRGTATRFVQQATLELLEAVKWSGEDRVCIVTTQSAKAQNWDASIRERSPRRGEPAVPYTPLEALLQGMRLKARVETLDIPDGKDEDEMWEIFDLLFSYLEDGDELFFDLTHSFRYLPMLLLVFGNYAKFLKGVTVRSITYGNFEARNEDGVAPVVDLLPLTALQDWTFGVADYLHNGNIKRLSNLVQQSLRPVLKKAYGKDGNELMRTSATQLRRTVESLKAVVEERQTCRGISVIESRSLATLMDNLEHVEETEELLPALMPMLKKVEVAQSAFDRKPNVRNAFAAAEWCYENQQYQAAVTFLEEGVITFFCQRHGIRLDDEGRRGLVNSALYFLREPEEYDPLKYSEEDRETIGRLMSDKLLGNRKFQNLYDDVCKLRNDYNHCGMRSMNQPMQPSKIMDNIGRSIAGMRETLLG